MNERDAWIALAATEGVGQLTFERVRALHGTAAAALEAVAALPEGRADRELAAMVETRIRPGLARRLRAATRDPRRVQREMAALGGWVSTPLDPGYPERLHHIEEPPIVLYGLGDQDVLQEAEIVAVVGTRRPTATGRDLAARIATRLAQAGAVTTSGLAMGIDGVAHLATLEAGRRTLAVVGSGLDTPGPAGHRRLARHIARQGAVVSELAPGVRATRGTFPRRNRIISGLSDATIVVEAPARSGALITARHALEQGRLLLVAPGRPLDPRVAGNLALLRESPARPLTGLDEMVADLGLDRARDREGQTRRLSLAGALELLAPAQRAVAETLAQGPRTVDAICRETGLAAGVVAASLTMLQLRGWARVHGTTQLAAGPLVGMDNERVA
ncbi:MAG: DNA-processing protein DprA [Chloroflexota bacterium]|jgi:DNA processing protein